MSFSTETKEELCKLPVGKRCCSIAEAYGVLLYCNMFTSEEIRIVTSCEGFARRLPKLFQKAFNCSFDSRSYSDIKGKTVLTIKKPQSIRQVFKSFGGDVEDHFAHHINLAVLEENCCKASFLRGAFLSGGSITDPAKSYHIELVTDHMSVSRETYSMILDMGLFPKDAERGGNYITYFKQSNAIEDFLTLIGAPVAAMDIMSAKVEKDMRNKINRRVNCDSANADKIVMASEEQLDAIREIEQNMGLENLPDKLQEAALLRIANPAASLNELASLAIPPVSKSCMNHRLRKLIDLGSEQV